MLLGRTQVWLLCLTGHFIIMKSSSSLMTLFLSSNLYFILIYSLQSTVCMVYVFHPVSFNQFMNLHINFFYNAHLFCPYNVHLFVYSWVMLLYPFWPPLPFTEKFNHQCLMKFCYSCYGVTIYINFSLHLQLIYYCI